MSCLTCGRLPVRWRDDGSVFTPSGEESDSQHSAVPSRADPLSASVPVAVYAAALLTTALIHQSQLSKLAAGDPGLHFIPLLSPPPSSFVIHQAHESRMEWSCYCKYPRRALSVVRSSSSPTPTCRAAGESCYVCPLERAAE